MWVMLVEIITMLNVHNVATWWSTTKHYKVHEKQAVFTPQLWDRNGSGTQPGARVHTCSTASSRFGTSRPPHDVIAVERFRNGSDRLCGVNAQPDAFRWRLLSPCVIMKNMQYIFPKKVCLSKNRHR